jgi:hypothetical protein
VVAKAVPSGAAEGHQASLYFPFGLNLKRIHQLEAWLYFLYSLIFLLKRCGSRIAYCLRRFFFSFAGAVAGERYSLTIVNMGKLGALFVQGQRPVARHQWHQ